MTASGDERWMRRALDLARRGIDRVSPNPMVGAVVVRSGRVVGEGFHRRRGGPHAEVVALEAAGLRARGATLYVTLEPCNHQGMTPACAPIVLGSGVRRVVMAVRDPNPLVRGGGGRRLARSGIEVVCGVLEAEARRLNESFFHHVLTGRPFVHWKCATSLDGRIATAGGESRWITGVASRAHAHRLRRWSDAILVGVGTVLADDPELTVRLGRGERKTIGRVVLDGELRTPTGCRLLGCQAGPVLVYAKAPTGDARGRARRLVGAGAEVVATPVERGRVDLQTVLRDLGRRGVGRLLVEGGGAVVASFLRLGLVDRATILYAPMCLGGDGVPAVAALGLKELADAPRFDVERVRRSGSDVCLELRRADGGR